VLEFLGGVFSCCLFSDWYPLVVLTLFSRWFFVFFVGLFSCGVCDLGLIDLRIRWVVVSFVCFWLWSCGFVLGRWFSVWSWAVGAFLMFYDFDL